MPNLLKHRIAGVLAGRFRNVKGGYFGRGRFRLLYGVYHFLPFLGFDYPRLVEWKFILRNIDKGAGMRILDVGCTSSLFIYELSRYGTVIGVDSRPYFEKLLLNIRFTQADISHLPFRPDLFDCVSMISVIEHVGLGAYGDPVEQTSDRLAMEELKRIIRPGGSLFLTTLIASRYIITGDSSQRIYDSEHLSGLIKGWDIVKEEYYMFNINWKRVNKEQAFIQPPERFALACLKLRKI